MICRFFLKFVLIISIVTSFSSCVRHRQLVSFQTPYHKKKSITHYPYARTPYRLMPGDNIDVKFSTTDKGTSDILNRESGTSGGSQINVASMYINSYTLDEKGDIEVPLIGRVHAQGHTTKSLSDTITYSLDSIVNLKNVHIKISNFRVSVMGEVRNPGQFFVYNDNINLLQALSLAGDISDYGNRRKVCVVRPSKDKIGSDVLYLDLTNTNVLSSEYFMIHPNDVIYVEPLKSKAGRLNIPALQVLLTVSSIVLVLLNWSR